MHFINDDDSGFIMTIIGVMCLIFWAIGSIILKVLNWKQKEHTRIKSKGTLINTGDEIIDGANMARFFMAKYKHLEPAVYQNKMLGIYKDLVNMTFNSHSMSRNKFTAYWNELEPEVKSYIEQEIGRAHV